MATPETGLKLHHGLFAAPYPCISSRHMFLRIRCATISRLLDTFANIFLIEHSGVSAFVSALAALGKIVRAPAQRLRCFSNISDVPRTNTNDIPAHFHRQMSIAAVHVS